MLSDPIMAIVPVKPLAESKTRLAVLLDADERLALAERLLKRTLLKLSRSRNLQGIAVISRDPEVRRIARTYGAWSIVESGSDGGAAGLNAALEQARRVCVANGARGILVLPADLPRVRVRDIEQILGLSEPAPRMVIVPAKRDGGTNALLLNPARAIDFQFGENSFERHMAFAAQSGVPAVVYDSDTVTLDLDLPQDLEELAKTTNDEASNE